MLRLEALRDQVATLTLAAVLARSQGGNAEIPDLDSIRAEFDQALAAPPEQVADPDKYVLMQALNLR